MDMFIEESLSTMQYASMASSIVNEPVKNEDERDRIIRELRVFLLKRSTLS